MYELQAMQQNCEKLPPGVNHSKEFDITVTTWGFEPNLLHTRVAK